MLNSQRTIVLFEQTSLLDRLKPLNSIKMPLNDRIEVNGQSEMPTLLLKNKFAQQIPSL